VSGVQKVIVVAVGENGVIGAENDLPWRLPTDLKHFKSLTLGKPMIMGRKTFESIGKPLPGRTTIILTRDESYKVEGCLIAHNVDMALRLGEQTAADMGANEIAIVGGAQVYQLLLPHTDKIELTRVMASPVGDAVFPDLGTEWRLQNSQLVTKTEKDSADMRFESYFRQKPAKPLLNSWA
jgi:dihydrofolate reductase